MSEIIILFLMVIIIQLCLNITITRVKIKPKRETETKIELNDKITKMYFEQLDKMIQYETICLFDSKFGQGLSDAKGATPDISNEDMHELSREIRKTVTINMAELMRNYLFIYFGEDWIHDYIKIYTLSMLLNYSNLSISSIVIAKNN